MEHILCPISLAAQLGFRCLSAESGQVLTRTRDLDGQAGLGEQQLANGRALWGKGDPRFWGLHKASDWLPVYIPACWLAQDQMFLSSGFRGCLGSSFSVNDSPEW